MAKFTLNAEFDTVEELRAFLSVTQQLTSCSSTCGSKADGETESAETESEQKVTRKRRTKAEIAAQEAAQQVTDAEIVQPTPAPEREAIVVPASAIEVLSPGENFTPAFDLNASLAQAAPQVAPVIQLAPAPGLVQTEATAPALPADLLGALSGLVTPAN